MTRRRGPLPCLSARGLRSSTLGWATFRTAIRYHFPPDLAPPGPGREPAPRTRLTPERPGPGDSPSKLLRFPMAVSCCGVAEGASPRLDEPGTIAKYARRCPLGIIAPSRGSNLDTAWLIEEILGAQPHPVGSHYAQVAGFSGPPAQGGQACGTSRIAQSQTTPPYRPQSNA
jgi:hypothetical protein